MEILVLFSLESYMQRVLCQWNLEDETYLGMKMTLCKIHNTAYKIVFCGDSLKNGF